MTRSAIGLLVLVATTLGAAACATGGAQIPDPEPTLVVPPVPPRSIDPPPVPPEKVEPAHSTEEPPPAPPPPRTNRTRPTAEAKAEPKPEPPVEVPAPPSNPPPVGPLRPATTPTGPEAVRQIKEIVDATQKMLDSVGTQTSDDRKANYATARSLVQQAEEALKKEELAQARSFAERAQQIAKVLLSGR